MSAIRDFFKKKKTDLSFKKAGPGHRLTDSSSEGKVIQTQPSSSQARQPLSEEAQRAAAAALARAQQKSQPISRSAQVIKAQVKKELEENASREQASSTPKKDIPVYDDTSTPLAVSGVYFKCPIVGPEVLPKQEMMGRIREFLLAQLEEERGLTACLIIHTFNERDKVQTGCEILARYLTNILDNPCEEKYRRIKLSNRIFREKVSCLEGALEFLSAAGFKSLEDTSSGEQILEFTGSAQEDLDTLQLLKEALLSAEAIRPELDRNLRLLRPQEVVAELRLPEEFFRLSTEEVKREQDARNEAVELMTTLRTKAMREKDEIRELHLYKYTLVRVRFPNDTILQGTFYVYEKFNTVKEFVRENLANPEKDFNLMLPGGSKLDENSTLLELKLVPAVILNFLWSDKSSDNCTEFLKPEIQALLSDI